MSAAGDASPQGSAPARSIARNALHLVVGQVLTTALSIALQSMLGRSLGAAEFGLLFLVTSWTAFVGDITFWGLPNHLVSEVARDPRHAGPLLGSGLVFRAGATLLVLGPAVLLIRGLGYDGRTQALFALAIVVSLPLALASIYGLVLRGYERMGRDAVITVAAKALSLALVLPTLLVGGKVGAVLVAQGLAGMGALFLAGVQARRLSLPPPKVERAALRSILVLGAPLVALGLQTGAQAFLESLILSKMAPAEVVGWYAAAKNLLGLLITPAAIIGLAAYPRLSRVAGDIPMLSQELKRVLRPIVWLGSLGAVGTFLFADVAVAIVYGRQKFAPATVVVQCFAPVLLLIFVESMLAYTLVAAGRARQLAIAKVAAIGTGVALNLAFIPWAQERFGNGGIGTVIGFGGAELFMTLSAIVLLPRGVLDRSDAIDGGRALLTIAATLGGMATLPALPPWISIPLCVIAFTAVSFLLGLLRPADVGFLRSALGPRR
jgi:O-antigen/teichoic acid export membrane protein